MNNKKMSSGQITGVGCDVTNCKYNTIDCKCSASQIKVQNDKATTKSETFCSTFCPRGPYIIILGNLQPFFSFPACQQQAQSASRAYQGLQAALVSRFSSLPRAFR